MLEAALPVFLLTYALISLQRFGGFQRSRPIASLLGAAANLITAEVARSHGFEFNWLRFTAIGLPVALLTLAISTLVIAYIPL